MNPSPDKGGGEDCLLRGQERPYFHARYTHFCLLSFGMLLGSFGISIAQVPDTETEWQYVIPAGVEQRVEGLFFPHKTEEAIGEGVLEKIIISKDEVSALVTNPDGSTGIVLIRHPLKADPGDRVFASVVVSFPVVDGSAVDESIAQILVDLIKKNDIGAFPWKKVFSKKTLVDAAQAERAGPWVRAGSLEAWKLYFAWGLLFLLCFFLAITRRRAAIAWIRNHPFEFWVLVSVIAAGTVLRLGFAPEAIYKEAYHFRNLRVIVAPVGGPVDLSYPAGVYFLYQLWHAATGLHPVVLLFGGNLFFGSMIPLLAALLGLRLHRSPSAPVLYGAIAAFLPHMVKYAHSEAATGPLAAMLLLALWSGSMVSRGIPFVALSGLAMGFVATIRPEGVLVFPGLLFWMLAFARAEKPTARNLADGKKPALKAGQLWVWVATALALLISFEALFRIWSMQAAGSGVSDYDFSVLSLDEDSSPGAVIAAVIVRIFDLDWNVILSPRFTPPPVVLLGFAGFLWFARTNLLASLSLAILYLGLAGVYAFFVSTLSNEGEMRYHLSMTPVLVVTAGAGAVLLFLRIVPETKTRIGLVVWVALILGCFVPYAKLVRSAEHPFQQEFLVLKERVLDPGLMADKNAMVFVPPPNESVLDIHSLTIGPMLSAADLGTALMPWHPSKLDEALGHLDDIPVYFYCGLYAHYLAGPDVEISEWWAGRMAELGLAMDDSSSPYLKEVFSEERPFLPNHEVLDAKFAKGVMKISLYRLMK